MKNPDSKPLRIVKVPPQLREQDELGRTDRTDNYGLMLSNLAIAQSNLVKAGMKSAMPHFIAIVKELEFMYNFKFEIMNDD